MKKSNYTRNLFTGISALACVAAMATSASAQLSSDDADNRQGQNETHIINMMKQESYQAMSSLTGPDFAEDAPHIVPRDDLDPNLPAGAGGILDSGVTGVGQMAVRSDQGSFSLGLCTGTLINPRTVLFAAHCVNSQSADSYGFDSGGTAISFGFEANNLPGVRRWVGLDGGTANATDEAFNIFNVEQVWYDPRSLEDPNAFGFLEGDIALATLDTHAGGIPTWAMLFSPITEETHVIINGYGGTGSGSTGASQAIDFRRRIAENMLGALTSFDDRNNFLFGQPFGDLPQTLYRLDFDSPDQSAFFDVDLYDGDALPNEGTTAGGDSGGPLIIDELYDQDVVAGVLSGGSRFFNGQAFSSYGTESFYQPLSHFWEAIVENNSYVYASARGGNRNWMNPNHWRQDMDPNYYIDVGGNLVNALPGFEELGVEGGGPQFGTICFDPAGDNPGDGCADLSVNGTPLVDTGPNSIYVDGGPGSTGFVPNNVVADPSAGIDARYYEVTLNRLGTTTLEDEVTIDRLNLGGQAELHITGDIFRFGPTGTLNVWGDYTQTGGQLTVDGNLNTGEAFLRNGLITGTGTFNPTYLTNLAGVIAPGQLLEGNRYSRTYPVDRSLDRSLTIAGDVILSRASTVIFDVDAFRTDLLRIVGDADNSGIIDLGGTAAVLSASGFHGARWGQSFEIITAEGGVQGEFDDVVGRIGILYPELTYNPNSVVATFRAGLFGRHLKKSGYSNPFSNAFAGFLDRARSSSYSDLSNVYGLVDIMEADQLNATFQGFSAAQAGRTTSLDEKQRSTMHNLVADRVSLMGTAQSNPGRMSIMGQPENFRSSANVTPGAISSTSFSQNYQSSTLDNVVLPENMSGFMSVGFNRTSLGLSQGASNSEEGSRHVAIGLEMAMNDKLSLGTAAGFADGVQEFGASLANVETNQASLYGNYRVTDNLYLGGQTTVTYSEMDSSSWLNGGISSQNLKTSSEGFSSELEAGYNLDLGGLTLTPRARVGYSSYSVNDFRDYAGDLAMAVDGITRSGVDAKLGVKLSGDKEFGFAKGWRFQPEIKADYVNRLSGNDTNFDIRFLDAENLGFALPIALQDAEYGEIKGGFNFTNGTWTFGGVIESRLGQQLYRDDRAVANMAVKF